MRPADVHTMSVRLIQLTDCHLFADPRADLKGICTRDCFAAVLEALRSETSRFDRLIITGDLAHDDRRETYLALRDFVGDWLPRVRVLPGNHDDRVALRFVFDDGWHELGERLVFTEFVGGWRLIGLDTQLTGEVKGRLGQPQLDWLDAELTAQRDCPIALFLHHPPVRVRSMWLDELNLEDSAELLSLIARHTHVKVVCAGHVHQELTVTLGSAVLFTTPSTGIQFQPESETLVIDSASPGYRVLELFDDGAVCSRVVRV